MNATAMTTTAMSLPGTATQSLINSGTRTLTAASTLTGTRQTSTSAAAASEVFPNSNPTPYAGATMRNIPAPDAACAARFSARNLTLVGRANAASTFNYNTSYSTAFGNCCAPQPVYLYENSCLLWCPYYAKPGESQSQANSRLDTCFRYNGFFGSYTLSVDDRVQVLSNGSTTTSFALVATADPTWTSTGVRSTGGAVQTAVAQGLVAGLPLLAGVLGAVML